MNNKNVIDTIDRFCKNNNADLLYVSYGKCEYELINDVYYFIFQNKNINCYFNLENCTNSIIINKDDIQYIGKSSYEFIRLLKIGNISGFKIIYGDSIFKNNNIFDNTKYSSFKDLYFSNFKIELIEKICNKIHNNHEYISYLKKHIDTGATLLGKDSYFSIQDYLNFIEAIYENLKFIFVLCDFNQITFNCKEIIYNIKDDDPIKSVINDEKIILNFINFIEEIYNSKIFYHITGSGICENPQKDITKKIITYDYDKIYNIMNLICNTINNNFTYYIDKFSLIVNKKSNEDLNEFYINLCKKYII